MTNCTEVAKDNQSSDSSKNGAVKSKKVTQEQCSRDTTEKNRMLVTLFGIHFEDMSRVL